MHGLTRRSVKHLCAPPILRVYQRPSVGFETTLCQTADLQLLNTQVLAFQHVARISNWNYSQERTLRAVGRTKHGARSKKRHISDLSIGSVENKEADMKLDDNQDSRLHALHNLRKRLIEGIDGQPSRSSKDNAGGALTLSSALRMLPTAIQAENKDLLEVMRAKYGNQPVSTVDEALGRIVMPSKSARRKVSGVEIVKAMAALGLVDSSKIDMTTSILGLDTSKSNPDSSSSSSASPTPRSGKQPRSTLMNAYNATLEARKSKSGRKPTENPPAKQPPGSASGSDRNSIKRTLVARELTLASLEVAGQEAHVPELSFDLSRVLFNPGIYQLQDPRSRVFNFDPYLAQPMPISEFNFAALNEYITSSKDETLIGHALAHRKRYIGSSSSMSGALCQLHFLLSQFREINTANVTRGFDEDNTKFTVISRAPAAIFLRWRNGVYAVDADKEYDEPNVLMGLGKSLEKLLTLEKSEFEKWRRTGTAEDEKFSDSNPEAYHYSTQGNFLLRSQLDAKDARLPGSGIFDLKTRAVAGIRMNVQEHQIGMGYQIKDRYGTWESFEREYYDMMRSAFLKYSMQVRMGNMDGIFVAYHNIARLFGFQYIPISELDLVIHGQSDPTIGDQEFRMSIEVLNQIFDIVTTKFPKQSIRFHFDTREPNVRDSNVHMNIFAEPMTDEDINDIQAKQDSEFAAYEKKLMGETISEGQPVELEDGTSLESKREQATDETPSITQSSDSSDANPEVLERVLQQVPADTKAPEQRPLLAFRVSIKNKVNDIAMIRPQHITAAARWTVDLTIDEIADQTARRQYAVCKNRRMSALKTNLQQSSGFVKSIHDLSRAGAVWRQEQDEIDAARERIVLYPN